MSTKLNNKSASKRPANKQRKTRQGSDLLGTLFRGRISFSPHFKYGVNTYYLPPFFKSDASEAPIAPEEVAAGWGAKFLGKPEAIAATTLNAFELPTGWTVEQRRMNRYVNIPVFDIFDEKRQSRGLTQGNQMAVIMPRFHTRIQGIDPATGIAKIDVVDRCKAKPVITLDYLPPAVPLPVAADHRHLADNKPLLDQYAVIALGQKWLDAQFPDHANPFAYWNDVIAQVEQPEAVAVEGAAPQPVEAAANEVAEPDVIQEAPIETEELVQVETKAPTVAEAETAPQ